jgi:hypothetical protein
MDWVQVGAKVAVLDRNTVSLTTVDRLTDTQIVLASGSRFSRRNGRRIGATAYEAALLLPLGDPLVRVARTRGQVLRVQSQVELLCKNVTGDQVEALAILDEVEKAVAAARKRIAALEGEG